jgi:serine/threonine protein kinase
MYICSKQTLSTKVAQLRLREIAQQLSQNKILIGKGAYGEIYTTSDSKYVCKKMRPPDDEDYYDTGVPLPVIREIAALKSLSNSQFVINLRGFIIKPTGCKIYLPKYEYDLCKYIQKYGGKLDQIAIKTIMFQIVAGLNDSISASIIHRDIKPGNILIDKQGSLVICDWGISKRSKCYRDPSDKNVFKYTNEIQTIWYRSPELLLGQKEYTYKIDMWSVGLIWCELLTGTPLLTGKTEKEQLNLITGIFGVPDVKQWEGVTKLKHWHYLPSDLNKQVISSDIHTQTLIKSMKSIDTNGLDLVSKMLRLNPFQRISFNDALNHPYFDEIKPLYKRLPKLNPDKHIDRINVANIVKTLNSYNRQVLLDKLSESIVRLNVPCSVYFLTCYYFDLYLSKKTIPNTNLLIYGCMSIAIKIILSRPIYISSEAKEYDEDILQMEIDIITTLDGQLYLETEYDILVSYGNGNIDKKIMCFLYLLTYDLEIRHFDFNQIVSTLIVVHNETCEPIHQILKYAELGTTNSSVIRSIIGKNMLITIRKPIEIFFNYCENL